MPKTIKILACFKCRQCGVHTYVFQTSVKLREPPSCSNPACRSKGPFDFVEEESTIKED